VIGHCLTAIHYGYTIIRAKIGMPKPARRLQIGEEIDVAPFAACPGDLAKHVSKIHRRVGWLQGIESRKERRRGGLHRLQDPGGQRERRCLLPWLRPQDVFG
jgi:hypothetical protein